MEKKHALDRAHSIDGWTLSPDGDKSWTLSGPARVHASLAFALDNGTTSCDTAAKIPKRVYVWLEKLAERLEAAELY